MPLSTEDRVLVLGASGFVGRRLVSELARKKIKLRLMIRDLAAIPDVVPRDGDVEVVRGDALEMVGLERALQRVHTAFYLMHPLDTKNLFRKRGSGEKETRAASNFNRAAGPTGLQRVIYLGASGQEPSAPSGSGTEGSSVAAILASGRPAATILWASMIVATGAASFEMLRNLAERLPVMGYPKWIDASIRPIAIDDVIAYLLECLFRPETAGQSLDMGGPELLSFRAMVQQYAEVCKMPARLIVRRPFGTSRVNETATVSPQDGSPMVEGETNQS
ncbi:MAG: NAD(P)H-binding protein, partial [bacterium]|nr:NAD(P)H-binding protein [bacterium]